MCMCACQLQLLRDLPDAPQLPMSYPGAMLLAACPPLHFAIMDARLDAYQQNKLQEAETAPAGVGDCAPLVQHDRKP